MKIVTFFIFKQLYLHHNRAPYPYIIIMKLSPMRGFIPMRPDLLRFIQWRENLEPDEYLPLPGKGFFSAYLTNMIELAQSMYFPGAVREARDRDEYSARLKFEAAPGLIDSTFFEYSPLITEKFNNVVYQALLEEQVRYVSIACEYTPHLDKKEALEHFRITTGLDEFRESDADIKASYRLRLHRGLVRSRPRKAV